MAPLTRARAPAAQAPALLDALARAPAAAALVVAALDQLEDRKALRLVHTQLQDAVGEATTTLEVDFAVPDPARTPTPRRWPRLEALTMRGPDLAALEALGAETWDRLRAVNIGVPNSPTALDAPAARALAAALRRMPALRALGLWTEPISDEEAAELFGAEGAAPGLRRLAIHGAELMQAAAGALAATGWPLEELELRNNNHITVAGLEALGAAPTLALRRLVLTGCVLNSDHLLNIANAPRWPLEELDLSCNNYSAAGVGHALAALSQHAGLRKLDLGICKINAAAFKALVEAVWPALTLLSAHRAKAAFDGPHALGAAAFAGFPALEELQLAGVKLGEAGAALLASRRWARLQTLNLDRCWIYDAGLAALVRAAWPALAWLRLRDNGLTAQALWDARRRAPALVSVLR